MVIINKFILKKKEERLVCTEGATEMQSTDGEELLLEQDWQ